MERPRQVALAPSFGAMARASQGGVALAPSFTDPKSLEPPGNLGHGVGAGLCRMWCMWWAEALALSLLMFFGAASAFRATRSWLWQPLRWLRERSERWWEEA